MKFKIKTKLIIAFAFLFVVIALLGGISSFIIYNLSENARNIMKDNYKTLEYTKTMLSCTDQLLACELKQLSKKNDSLYSTEIQLIKSEFEAALRSEEKNITETGEKELVGELRLVYQAHFEKNTNSHQIDYQYFASITEPSIIKIRTLLHQISDLNMDAIVKKDKINQKASQKAFIMMSVLSTICFLFTLPFIINFPNYIADPIKRLSESIKHIANRNYNIRIDYKSSDEFGELAESFNKMASKLEEYDKINLEKILFEKKRIETVINNMTDGIVILDEDHKILFINEFMTNLLNLNPREITDKTIIQLSMTNPEIAGIFSNINATNDEINHIKLLINKKDYFFSREVIKVELEPSNPEQNSLIGNVIIIRDITTFKELDKAKTHFLATVSHELKTPLASMKLSLKLLEDERVGTTNPEQSDLIRNIRNDSERLLKITSELLKLAQLESGKIQLSFQVVEPGQIVVFACNALKTQATHKNVVFKVDSPSSLPMIYADSEKITWVLINLIGNAIRYSQEGGLIEIQVQHLDKKVLFSVRDYGEGISPEFKDKVFDRFYMIPSDMQTGSGLGLAISKDFISGHHGEIWVESEVGQGCKFCFTLPDSV